jgi:hypothetical protein
VKFGTVKSWRIFLMECKHCGTEMKQVEKDTSSGRDIREYKCTECGHTDWEDRGEALWKILSDDRERNEAEKASPRESLPEAPESKARPEASAWDWLRARLAMLFARKP